MIDISEYENEHNVKPTRDYMSEALGFDEEKIKLIEKVLIDPLSLNLLVNDDDDTTYQDMIPSPGDNIEDTVMASMRGQVLRSEMKRVLTPKEYIVISSRFGLEDNINRTLEEVGEVFNVTRERIRQIEAKAIRKLRMRSKLLKQFI